MEKKTRRYEAAMLADSNLFLFWDMKRFSNYFAGKKVNKKQNYENNDR